MPTTTQPTAKQLTYLNALARERGLTVPEPETRSEASAAIKQLLTKPHAPRPLTAKQQTLLKNLHQQLRRAALDHGETFTYPHTIEQARAELERLRSRARSANFETRLDRDAIHFNDPANQPASSIHDDEIDGYGSTATWANIA
jgi:hypothetical protein